MEPFYQDNSRTLYHKDCRDMSELNADSLDLLVTDPPYGISFMGKDWDTFNEVVPPQGAYQHKKGFKKLPRQNTASMTEFFVPIWKECLRVLKPGAFCFVMCSPRADVMAKQINALQGAGFLVNFTPIYWAYASGFPKAQNIGKAVDKKLGTEKIIGKGKAGKTALGQSSDWNKTYNPHEFNIVEPNSPQAKALDGSYGGFQPKPAVEVIIVAMKPLSEKTFVGQALKNQKGITWLDDGRIPYDLQDKPSAGNKTATFGKIETVSGGDGSGGFDANPQGRFPANLLVSDDVLNDGRVTKSSPVGHKGVGWKHSGNTKDEMTPLRYQQEFSDSGSFSRYFDLDKWWAKTFPFLIVPKASKSEKDRGLDMPEVIKSGLPLRDGSGDYVENEYGNGSKSTRRTRAKNIHPTVKPLKLMSYLITLGSREGDTVLDPFSGSGTTAVASKLLGRKCIGIEIEEKYCEIAANRCRQSVMDLSKYSQ